MLKPLQVKSISLVFVGMLSVLITGSCDKTPPPSPVPTEAKSQPIIKPVLDADPASPPALAKLSPAPEREAEDIIVSYTIGEITQGSRHLLHVPIKHCVKYAVSFPVKDPFAIHIVEFPKPTLDLKPGTDNALDVTLTPKDFPPEFCVPLSFKVGKSSILFFLNGTIKPSPADKTKKKVETEYKEDAPTDWASSSCSPALPQIILGQDELIYFDLINKSGAAIPLEFKFSCNCLECPNGSRILLPANETMKVPLIIHGGRLAAGHFQRSFSLADDKRHRLFFNLSGEVIANKAIITTPVKLPQATHAGERILLVCPSQVSGYITGVRSSRAELQVISCPAGMRSGSPCQIEVLDLGTQGRSVEAQLIFEMSGQAVQVTPVSFSSPGASTGIFPIPPPPFVTRRQDPSLYVSASEAMAQKSSLTFIDCRDFKRQQGCALEGSLPMMWSALKTKPDLKHKTLVLISDGPLSYESEQAVKSLRLAGFASVRCLEGGLQAWRDAGGALRGEASIAGQCSALDALWARDYAPEVQFISSSTLPRELAAAFPKLSVAAELQSIPPATQLIYLDVPAPSSMKKAYSVEGGVKALQEALAKLPPARPLVPGNAECGGCM